MVHHNSEYETHLLISAIAKSCCEPFFGFSTAVQVAEEQGGGILRTAQVPRLLPQKGV
jgi:hypothetical protein